MKLVDLSRKWRTFFGIGLQKEKLSYREEYMFLTFAIGCAEGILNITLNGLA